MALTILSIQQTRTLVSIDFTIENEEDSKNIFDVLHALTFTRKLSVVYGFPAYQENMFPCGNSTLQNLRFEDSKMFHSFRDTTEV